MPDKWFQQRPDDNLWPGEAYSLAITQTLHEETTLFQSILVFESLNHGKVLVLDGIIQLTERDEANYHEMLIHPALCAHADPRQILIIGAGDGGATRECVKCPLVEHVTHVEIDAKVVEVCQKYFPNLASSFSNNKVSLLVQDGVIFLQTSQSMFDVIVVDSSDPFSGPNGGLFTDAFYQTCRDKLNPGGMLCFQAEYHLLHLDLIVRLFEKCKELFPTVRYYFTNVPTYPGGGIGFILCSLDVSSAADLTKPRRAPPAGCKYYSPSMHSAAFVLPAQVEETLKLI